MKTGSFPWLLLHPRHWLLWLVGVPLLALLGWLPWGLQRRIGTGIGVLAWRLARQRRNDTETNIRLCFPELDAPAQAALVRETFINGGIGLLETAAAWFRPMSYYRSRVTITGLEHLETARSRGRGVLLLGAHYCFLDLCGLLGKLHFPVDTVYRPQNNPALEWLVRRLRRRVYDYQIDHDNMRLLIRALKENHVVWYTPDQDFGLKQGVFAPFFGQKAATLTSPRRIARINDSPVLMIHFRRLGNEERYEILITPPLDHYPTEDAVADATRVNAELERLIRRAPGQYMWFHRRFKTRPPGEKPPYIKKKREIREAAALAREQERASGGRP